MAGDVGLQFVANLLEFASEPEAFDCEQKHNECDYTLLPKGFLGVCALKLKGRGMFCACRIFAIWMGEFRIPDLFIAAWANPSSPLQCARIVDGGVAFRAIERLGVGHGNLLSSKPDARELGLVSPMVGEFSMLEAHHH